MSAWCKKIQTFIPFYISICELLFRYVFTFLLNEISNPAIMKIPLPIRILTLSCVLKHLNNSWTRPLISFVGRNVSILMVLLSINPSFRLRRNRVVQRPFGRKTISFWTKHRRTSKNTTFVRLVPEKVRWFLYSDLHLYPLHKYISR